MKENITIEINGIEIEAVVEFEYTPAVKGRTCAQPEYCIEDELEIFDFTGLYYGEIDLSELLAIEEIADNIIEQLKEAE